MALLSRRLPGMLGVIAAVSMLAVPAGAEAPYSLAGTLGQLPKSVVPSAYKIDIVTNLRAENFIGHEEVQINVMAPLRGMVLNQAGLKISRAVLQDGSAALVAQDDDAQTARLTFPKTLVAGHYILSIDYAGPITTNPFGIYHDDYKTAQGVAKSMLVTQFEVGDARRMFPGWDEPVFKATFALGITVPKDFTAVSNMPIATQTPVAGGEKHVVFETTPKMSSYLLAFVAGDLQDIHSQADGVMVDLWAPAGTQAQGDYALQSAVKILPYYDEYFGVKYPLPKLSLIAVPGNYEAGAMENWGAITFIDDSLLYDAATSAPETKEEIYITVAHEMSHLWTGDLVTMAWWNDIWLNEGFATWMETKATDHFNPSWQEFPRQHADREAAMAQDAQPTTHPILQPIADVSAANAAFDGITYQKGEQVIRMIEDWLGPDTFRDGMRLYIKRHAYGSATSADLWAALSAASHRDVAAVGNSFIEQPGIPLVHVATACVGGETVATLTQDRFAVHDPNPARLTWTIPVTVGGPDVATQKVILAGAPVRARFAGCGDALKANLGEDGYYRTQYDAASFAALRTNFATLNTVDRADLAGDQYALFAADRAPLGSYLDLVANLQDETSNAMWDDTIGNLATIDGLLRGDPARPAFRLFAIAVLMPEFQRLGWDARPGENFLDGILRPRMIGILGALQDPAITAEAQKRFAAFLWNPGSLAADLRNPVTRIVGMHADQATWALLKQLGIAAPSTEEKLRFFSAMAAAQNPVFMDQNIAFATSGAVPNGRILEFLGDIESDGDNPNAFLAAILSKPAAVRAALNTEDESYLLQVVGGDASDLGLAARIKAGVATNASAGTKMDAAKTVDLIETNAQLHDRAAPAAAAWLEAHRWRGHSILMRNPCPVSDKTRCLY